MATEKELDAQFQEKHEQVTQEKEVTTKEPSKVNKDGNYVVDMSKGPKKTEQTVTKVDMSAKKEKVKVEEDSKLEKVEEIKQEAETKDDKAEVKEVVENVENKDSVLEKVDLVKDVEDSKKKVEAPEQAKEEVVEDAKPNIELPENVEKLVEFLKDNPGSTMEEYVRLNSDYSKIDENQLLKEYYKNKKSHLSSEDIDFLIEDKFTYDEDMDDEREIKRKKLAYKEEIADARQYLSGLKDKYYAEVKSTSKLAPEQAEAVEFYNKYKEQQKELTAKQTKQAEHFVAQTDKVFSDDFKGFDFKVGESTYRYKVGDVKQTKEAQSDLIDSFKTFLGEDNLLADPKGYHKALFAARNADAIAAHFYEQGRADSVKEIMSDSKNVNMSGRKTSGVIETGGVKVKVISGNDSSRFGVKKPKYE